MKNYIFERDFHRLSGNNCDVAPHPSHTKLPEFWMKLRNGTLRLDPNIGGCDSNYAIDFKKLAK
jgi:hypothetical protein